MTSVAYEAPSRTGRPPLLEWRPALAASFVSWVATLMCIGAIGIPASELGLIARPRGSGLRDWPYPEAGQASLAANAVVWFLMIALTALLIRVVLTTNGARPVPWVTVFAVLATTGFVPFLPHGLLDAPWLVALLLTAALLRFSSALELPPVPKRLSVVAIAAAGLLLLVPALHAVRHPLWAGSTVLDGGQNSVTFSVRNAGFAAVELEAVSLRLPDPRASLVETGGVRADKYPPAPPDAPFPESPRLPFTIKGRGEVFVQLRLNPQFCGSGTLPTTAVIKYRVRGASRAESLPMPIAAPRCS